MPAPILPAPVPTTHAPPSSPTVQQQQHHAPHAPHQHQHQQHQQQLTAAHFAARKQWEAKLVSLQRGMEHVQHCRAGDACGSSLCHSTRRLMQTYESHQCPPSPSPSSISAAAVDCKVCKLWDFLMARRSQMAAIAHLRRPLARSCATSAAMVPTASAPRRGAASVFHRVVAAQKEARHLSARRRF